MLQSAPFSFPKCAACNRNGVEGAVQRGYVGFLADPGSHQDCWKNHTGVDSEHAGPDDYIPLTTGRNGKTSTETPSLKTT